MSGDLFTNFNSTLAFDGIFSIRSKIAFILCGSFTLIVAKFLFNYHKLKVKCFTLYFKKSTIYWRASEASETLSG